MYIHRRLKEVNCQVNILLLESCDVIQFYFILIGKLAMLYEKKNTDLNKLTCKLSNSIFQTPWYSFLLSKLVVFLSLHMKKVSDHQNILPCKIESCKSRHHQCWCPPLWNKLTWEFELWLLHIWFVCIYAISFRGYQFMLPE